jgi:membrane carboxypeptidase/penicillin-binding protein
MQGMCEPWKRGDSAEQYFVTGRRTVEGGFTRPRAGKTGTTQNSYDTWFCGFSAQYTTVVWIGYDDNRSLGRGTSFTGGALVSPIWTEFMVKAHEGMPERDFRVPPGVEFYGIDRATGLAGGQYREAYIRGTKPPTQIPIFLPETLEELYDPRMTAGAGQ